MVNSDKDFLTTMKMSVFIKFTVVVNRSYQKLSFTFGSDVTAYKSFEVIPFWLESKERSKRNGLNVLLLF